MLDHQAYTASFEQCKGWVVSMRKKLETQSDVKGDKRTVQERIEKLKVGKDCYKIWSFIGFCDKFSFLILICSEGGSS